MHSIYFLILSVLLAMHINHSECTFGFSESGDGFLLPFLLGSLTCRLNNDNSDHAPCPDGWLRFRNHCYLFSKETRKWFEAQAICRSLKGALVQIDSQKESDWITARATEIGQDRDYLIGANSLANMNKYVWEFTQKRVPLSTDTDKKGFQNWAPGEPDDEEGERCAAIEHEESYMWDGDGCDEESEYYICERKAGCISKGVFDCY